MIPDRYDVPVRQPVQYIPPPPPPPPPPPRPSDDELKQMAEDVSSAGDRSFLGVDGLERDNYEARLDRFAQVMEPLDSESRARLMGFMLEEDDGAPHSWLTLDRLDSRADGGHISAAERAAVYESIALAYTDGSGEVGLDEIDSLVIWAGDYSSNETVQAQIESFTSQLSPSAASRFTQQLGIDLIEREMQAQAEQMPRHGVNLGTVGARLLGETPEGRKLLADFYVSLGEPGSSEPTKPTDQQKLFLETMAQNPFGVIGSPDDEPDGVALVCQALSEQTAMGDTIPYGVGSTTAGRTDYDDVAVGLTRWAYENQDYFDSGGVAYDQRAEAMTDLFMSHDDAILNDLTDPMTFQYTAGKSDYEHSSIDGAKVLGNLYRMTFLNPDVAAWKSEAVQTKLVDYALANFSDATVGNGQDGAGEVSISRTRVLLFSVHEGVKQSYGALEDQRAAQEQFVGFFTDRIIDTAVSAGTKAGPQGMVAQAVIGAGLDLASSEAKTWARGEFTDLLFGEYDTSEVDAQQSMVNALFGDYLIGEARQQVRQEVLAALPPNATEAEKQAAIDEGTREVNQAFDQIDTGMIASGESADDSRGG
jgi:hypothetical protein